MKCKSRLKTANTLLALTAAVACSSDADIPSTGLPDDVEAISLLGDELRAPALDLAVQAQRAADLEQAQAAYDATPGNADSIIWLGRRLAYLGRYRDAIEAFSVGLQVHPEDARLYRHRGHRYITTRQLDRAVTDFMRASELVAGHPDEVEPDGAPNALGIPTSTLQSNIWYHLGLAHYLLGDFARALEAYRECMDVSGNPDMQIATSHWLYMTLQRLGRGAEAAAILDPIHAGMPIIENDAYHRLLLMYKGELGVDDLLGGLEGTDAINDATVAYGVGNWHLYHGREHEALEMFERILEGPQWAAFGYIAAEAELARRRSHE